MHEARVQQLADHETWAACGLKLVHIRLAIGVDMGERGHHMRQSGKVIPINQNACCACNRHPMNQVVGRAACGQQGDHGVDDTFLVHHLADGHKPLGFGDLQNGANRLSRQLLAQRIARVDKCRPRHMQAHRFEQHLVAVGGAIKGTGAHAVISLGLGLQQLCAAHQALGCQLAHFAFFGV